MIELIQLDYATSKAEADGNSSSSLAR